MTRPMSWSDPEMRDRSRLTMGRVGVEAGGGGPVEEAGEVAVDEPGEGVGPARPSCSSWVRVEPGTSTGGWCRSLVTWGRVGWPLVRAVAVSRAAKRAVSSTDWRGGRGRFG